ncbi:hypothetical protein SAMN02910276_01400 [Butyrivibrio sp. Su6]|uniref:hypothetical protein n=1 Tax=Butyrivibrio sp. Su6 TaxID=1520810 RepID=UPI00089F605A|nr:hypothetical protein [Butyrivibrio sp. Su6]SEF90440.1 hypothetical protein SAMN02910276_01400 [Butyrivibrio sp. Su6]
MVATKTNTYMTKALTMDELAEIAGGRFRTILPAPFTQKDLEEIEKRKKEKEKEEYWKKHMFDKYIPLEYFLD